MATDSIPQPDPTQAALNYAREIAQMELANIDRIHARTVKTIGWVMTAATILFLVIGWIGFLNLKAMAVSAAETQMQAEVARQVRTQLTEQGITKIVKEQVRSFSADEIHVALKNEIESGPLHQEILDTAGRQSQQLLTRSIGDRHLSHSDAMNLEHAIRANPELRTKRIEFLCAPNNAEAYRYKEQIKKALHSGGITRDWDGDNSDQIADSGIRDGVVIFYSAESSPSLAEEFREVFKAASIEAQVVSTKAVQAEGDQPRIIIFIGTRRVQ